MPKKEYIRLPDLDELWSEYISLLEGLALSFQDYVLDPSAALETYQDAERALTNLTEHPHWRARWGPDQDQDP